MKKTLLLAVLSLLIATLQGCSERIPAGHVGKVLTTSGWSPEVLPPSKVTLGLSSHLVIVETTTKKFNAPIEVLLKDKLTLTAEVVFRCRVNSKESVLNSVFNDMPLEGKNLITTEEVYNVYGKMVVLNTAREVISRYNVDEVNQNYARITAELYQAIKPKLEGLPIEISDVTIGNIGYPKIVTDAIEEAKKRRMEIEQEQAQVQIELERVRGREAVAKAEYRIKMLEAKRIRDYNSMIEQGVTPNLLALRRLEVQEQMVKAIQKNDNVIYMPMDMMNGIGMMRNVK